MGIAPSPPLCAALRKLSNWGRLHSSAPVASYRLNRTDVSGIPHLLPVLNRMDPTDNGGGGVGDVVWECRTDLGWQQYDEKISELLVRQHSRHLQSAMPRPPPAAAAAATATATAATATTATAAAPTPAAPIISASTATPPPPLPPPLTRPAMPRHALSRQERSYKEKQPCEFKPSFRSRWSWSNPASYVIDWDNFEQLNTKTLTRRSIRREQRLATHVANANGGGGGGNQNESGAVNENANGLGSGDDGGHDKKVESMATTTTVANTTTSETTDSQIARGRSANKL